MTTEAAKAETTRNRVDALTQQLQALDAEAASDRKARSEMAAQLDEVTELLPNDADPVAVDVEQLRFEGDAAMYIEALGVDEGIPRYLRHASLYMPLHMLL